MFAKPRKAATIAIVRNNRACSSIEMLLMKRGRSDRFLPSYYVFPGGAVDEQDRPLPGAFAGDIYPGIRNEEERLDLMTHISAAIRETFEESGILLARDDSGVFAETGDTDECRRLCDYRKMISVREISFSAMLSEEKLHPALDSLHYMTRWITPVFSPIRYDARFFAAVCPENQHIIHDGDELVETLWITPEEAAHAYSSGSIKMVTPTISTVRFLSRFKSAEEMTLYFTEKERTAPMRSF